MIETRKDKGNLVTNVVRLEHSYGTPIQNIYEGVHDGELLAAYCKGISTSSNFAIFSSLYKNRPHSWERGNGHRSIDNS